jgi:hypothetical protein
MEKITQLGTPNIFYFSSSNTVRVFKPRSEMGKTYGMHGIQRLYKKLQGSRGHHQGDLGVAGLMILKKKF